MSSSRQLVKASATLVFPLSQEKVTALFNIVTSDHEEMYQNRNHLHSEYMRAEEGEKSRHYQCLNQIAMHNSYIFQMLSVSQVLEISHNTPDWQLCEFDLRAIIEISVFASHTTRRLVHNGVRRKGVNFSRISNIGPGLNLDANMKWKDIFFTPILRL